MDNKSKLLDAVGKRISGKEDKKVRFDLLYKATDNVDVKEFHKNCDAKGPTVTILHGKHNCYFGGYTSKDWSSQMEKRTVTDETAFLFTMNDNEIAKCIFLPIRKNKADAAITCYQKYGPTFGEKRNYDLHTFKQGKKESEYKDDLLHLNGSINVNNAFTLDSKKQRKNGDDADGFGLTKIKSKDINSGSMVVKSLEVYQVISK